MIAEKEPETGRWICEALSDIVYEEMINKLKEKINFTFARYGDGEWFAILGKNGSNCDNHQYFPDMGKQLKSIVDRHPDYYMGLQPLTVHHMLPRVKHWVDKGKWVNADCLHNASIDGNLNQFIEQLEDRETILVGPAHLKDLDFWNTFIEVPKVNCWLKYNDIFPQLVRNLNNKSDIVVVFCASMMSNVMIDELYNSYPQHTYIDAGSVFDPYVNVKSRSYHHKLKL